MPMMFRGVAYKERREIYATLRKTQLKNATEYTYSVVNKLSSTIVLRRWYIQHQSNCLNLASETPWKISKMHCYIPMTARRIVNMKPNGKLIGAFVSSDLWMLTEIRYEHLLFNRQIDVSRVYTPMKLKTCS